MRPVSSQVVQVRFWFVLFAYCNKQTNKQTKSPTDLQVLPAPWPLLDQRKLGDVQPLSSGQKIMDGPWGPEL